MAQGTSLVDPTTVYGVELPCGCQEDASDKRPFVPVFGRSAYLGGVTLWFACRRPATPRLTKILCIVVVAYTLSPIDLVPNCIPVLGYLDASWRRNLNSSQRARVINEGTASEAVEIRETTIDLAKLVSLPWKASAGNTLSDRRVVSGISGQTGMYSDPYGRLKDITSETGLPGSAAQPMKATSA